MRSKTGLGRGATALAVLLCASPTSGQGQSSEPVRMDEITVTANKRPQRLGEVDGSVAVRTAEDLERARVTKVEDLGKVFPGLIINERGNRAYANVTVRGVTSPDFYNPAVQVYVDGVPQDSAISRKSCSMSIVSSCCADRKARSTAATPMAASSTSSPASRATS